MKKFSHIFLPILTIIPVLLSNFPLFALSTKDINGTHRLLKQEYQQPFAITHGTVLWESNRIKMQYYFGFDELEEKTNKKKESQPIWGSNTTKLIKKLFHEAGGDFGPTEIASNPASHFSSELIGEIIAATEHLNGKNETYINQQLLEVIKQNKSFQQSIAQSGKKYKKICTQLDGLKNESEKAEQQNKEQYESIQTTITQLEKEKKRYDIRNTQGKPLRQLVRALIGSLKECGFLKAEKEPLYPPYTTQKILTAFVYKRAKDKKELKQYYDAVQKTLGIDSLFVTGNSSQILQVKSFDAEQIPTILDGIKKAAQEKSGNDLYEFLLENYEKIIFAQYTKPKALPKIIGHCDILFESATVADCAETTTRNLCNIVAYNQLKNLFSLLANLAALGIQPEAIDERVKQFYTQNNKVINLDDTDVHQAWSVIMEDRPYVVYNRIIKPGGGKDYKAEAPIDTQGFIYGITLPKGTAVQKRIITFGNGQSDIFDQATINDKKYIIVDHNQYRLYEMQPSLRNVIVILNMFFGLQLFDDIKTAWIEPDFNTKYFPLLCKKLNWTIYESPKENLDEQDYKKESLIFSIITTGGNSGAFDLHLSSWHGQVMVNEKNIDEEFQQISHKILSLIEKTSEFGSRNHKFDQCTMLNCYGIFYQGAFPRSKKQYLNYYCIFLENLFDHQSKLKFIRLLLPGFLKDLLKNLFDYRKMIGYIEKNYRYSLAAKLIESLPINADLHYQTKVFESLLNMEAQKEEKINSALKKVMKKIPTDTEAAIKFYMMLIRKGYENAFPYAADAAVQGIASTNTSIRNLAKKLFRKLSYRVPEKYEKEVCEKLTYGLIKCINNQNIVIFHLAIDLSTKFIELRKIPEKYEDVFYKKIIYAAFEAYNIFDNMIYKSILDLFVALVNKIPEKYATKYGLYEKATKIEAERFDAKIMSSLDLSILKLIIALINNAPDKYEKIDEIYKLATDIAIYFVVVVDYEDLYNLVFQLFKTLFDKGQGYIQAREVVKKMLESKNKDVLETAEKLKAELIKRKQW